MEREGGGAVIRQAHLIAVVVSLLMGCAVLFMAVGCAGVRSGTPQEEEEQGHTQATEEQERSSEEARCGGTRTVDLPYYGSVVTNDMPGCPNKGGLLSGTDGPDKLYGGEGDDEIRGLGGDDELIGGTGNDVIYGGPGNERLLVGGEGDDVLYGGEGDDENMGGGKGQDVLYGGDGNDQLFADDDKQRDKLYCGEGWDIYLPADKIDYVSSSCEGKAKDLRPSHGTNFRENPFYALG